MIDGRRNKKDTEKEQKWKKKPPLQKGFQFDQGDKEVSDTYPLQSTAVDISH